MNKTRKIARLRSCAAYLLTIGCVASISAHMCFVYMSGQHMNTVVRTEEEIYDIRGKVVQMASTGVERVDTQNVVASHLVVAEPITVSAAQ